MFLKSLLINGIILAFFVQQSIGNRKCYEAKTCIHNNKEKCGRDKNGKVRRFIDTCDMLEYNCLRGTDYVKIDLIKCKSLPLIKDQAASGIDQEGGDFTEKDDVKETNAQESVSDNDEATENNLAAESDVSKGDVSVSVVVPGSNDHNDNVEETNVVPGSGEDNDENDV